MKYLFINTSTNKLIISIVEDNEIKYLYDDNNSNELSSKIMPIIDEAFKETKMVPNDIDTIFVTNGPGSFTGIRIGLTIAKVMAWSLKIKVIPISSLEFMASGHNGNEYVVPMIDARRDYVFAGMYDSNLNSIIKDEYILFDEFIKKISNKKYNIVSHELDYDEPQYDVIKIINKHINDEGINPHKLNPNYLKLTEAEEKFNEGR